MNNNNNVNNTPHPPTIIDTDTVTPKQVRRLDDFSREIIKGLMSRYEHLFDDKIPDKKIIVSEWLDVNKLDVPQFYPFKDLNYIIFRDKSNGEDGWTIRIKNGFTMLVEAKYKKTV